MKKLILICLTVQFCVCVYSQSCVMNEDAKRYYNRGITATQIAKSTDDYKNALAEYQKAAELCSDCSELYYRMGLCCEIIGEDDNSYYSSALKYFKKSLSAEDNISQELKDLIRGKIDGMEYAVEQAAVANKDALIPENLCGRWTFHASDGRTDKTYNVIIIEDHGIYLAEFVLYSQYDIGEDRRIPNDVSSTIKRKVNISFRDNVICFSTNHTRTNYYLEDSRETYCKTVEFDYELILEDRILKGSRICTYSFEGSGNGNYSTVKEAVKNGYGKVFSNCTGNCGTSNVYFTK